MNHKRKSRVSASYAALTKVLELGNVCVSTIFLPALLVDVGNGLEATSIARGRVGTHCPTSLQPLLSAAYFDPAFLNFIRSAVGPCRALWFCRICGKKKPGLQAGQSLSEIGSRKP